MRERGAPVFIRRARRPDQARIRAIIREARINPSGLRWERFLVAEAAGQVVGTVQLKPHRDGTLELASLAVVRGRKGEGIAGALVRAILRGAQPPIYLTCSSHLGAFYPRFGFRALARAEMPRDLRRIHRVVNLLIPLRYPAIRLLVMRWDGLTPPRAPAP